MDPALNDKRFARSVPKYEQKVKIDKRSQSKFSGDKRGRPNRYTTDKNQKKFYDPSSSSESKKSRKSKAKPKADSDDEGRVVQNVKKLYMDYAREEAALEASSSEEDSSDSDEERQQVASGLIHPWNEPDFGDFLTEILVTRRLAICNVDWEKFTARDLYARLNSCTPPGGLIKTVKVYLSDIGRQQLLEEGVAGSMSEKPLGHENKPRKESQERKKYHMEKSKADQFKRLEYFYAVVECDSETTASKIYEECDGYPFETSGPKMHMSYIIDAEEFDEEPHSMADGSTNTGLKEKTKSMVENKMSPENITPRQQYLNQKNEKKSQKREDEIKDKDQNKDGYDPDSDDDLPSAIKVKSKKCKKKIKRKTKETKTKSKNSEEKYNFQIDVDDPRFPVIFNSRAYNIDPSDSNFEGMEALIGEKQKRKPNIEDASVTKPPTGKRQKTCDNPILESRDNEPLEVSVRSSLSAELSLLLKSAKNKARNFKRKT